MMLWEWFCGTHPQNPRNPWNPRNPQNPRKWCHEVRFRCLLPRAPVGQDDGSLSKLPQITLRWRSRTHNKFLKRKTITNEQFPLSHPLAQSDFRLSRVGCFTAEVGKLQSLTVYPVKLRFPWKRKIIFSHELTNRRDGLSKFWMCHGVLNFPGLLN